jgi:transcriptional regulator with XRE-family HTH domain
MLAAMDERTAYAAVAGQLIQKLRTGRLSQEALATRAGLSQSALSRFENGQTMPDLYEVRSLARALGETPSELIAKIDEAFVRTTEAAKKVSPGVPWAGIAAGVFAGLAVVGVATMLDEAAKKRHPAKKR